MRTPKQTLLFSFICLQLIGAVALIAAFFIELWPLELLVSFTPVAMALLLAALAICSGIVLGGAHLRRSLPLIGVTATTWLAALFIVFQAFTAQQPITLVHTDEKKAITFATLNKLYTNYDFERFTDYLNDQDIDILALQEMRPAEVQEVAERLGFEYVHMTRTFASSGGTAVVLLSRFPFISAETVELATNHPVVRAEVETPSNGAIVVYAVHIPVPSSKFLYNKRNIVLDSLAETIQQEALPVLIGGDFNTTVYSPAMRRFSTTVSPRIAPIATERIPACSWYGYGLPLCVRIDHIFAPRNAQITDFTISPAIGADHRAIIADIVLDE